MPPTRPILVLVLLALAALAAPVAAAPLSATLEGENEVTAGGAPDQGDLDGTGSATVALKAKKKRICADIDVSGIALPATAAHIHPGAAGTNGPPLVTLPAPGEDGQATGCVRAGRALIRQIKADPAAFYVNVHNVPFPNGALRGQLGPS